MRHASSRIPNTQALPVRDRLSNNDQGFGMDLHLKNKVAIITGASRGIGRSIAQLLSAEGMNLVIAARSGEQLDEVVKSCHSEAVPVAIDLRDEEAPQRLI